MKYSVCLFLLLAACASKGQSYNDGIKQYREQYIKELLAEPRHPVRASQAKDINFFAADSTYAVWAELSESHGSKPFLIPTHSGKQKPFREYGVLTFHLHDSVFTLHVYQSVDLLNAGHNDDLFVPFNDLTNYETTYGGGRYIDLSTKDVKDGKLLLDFNKCYNPYCAYADGFSCPIPPSENSLSTAITVGEKTFLH